MSDEQPREVCSRRGCGEHAVVVSKIYTDDGPMCIAVCMKHILSVSEILESMVQGMIIGN